MKKLALSATKVLPDTRVSFSYNDGVTLVSTLCRESSGPIHLKSLELKRGTRSVARTNAARYLYLDAACLPAEFAPYWELAHKTERMWLPWWTACLADQLPAQEVTRRHEGVFERLSNKLQLT